MEHLQSNTFSSFLNGQKLISLQRVSSTNDYLKHELSKSAPLPEGTVIMAEEQTRGRGQAGNFWESEAGKNLTFSLLLKPSFLAPSEQFDLNIVVCTAIYKVLFPLFGAALKIKWPNDILVHDQKLAGILIENSIQGKTIRDSVIGIGINVNQSHFSRASRACSIKQILHREYILEDLLCELCCSIEEGYRQLKNRDIQVLKQLYITSLYGYAHFRTFRLNGAERAGTIRGVDGDGRLTVDIDGRTEKFASKEIEFVY